MISPTDIVIAFGLRGSGKSFLTRKLSEAFPRRVVFDRLQEWSDENAIFVSTFEDFAREWQRVHALNRFTIVFQFDIESSSEIQSAEFNEVIRIVYKSGRSTGHFTTLFIEEIHFFAGPHFIEPWLFEATLTGRHSHIGIIANTQRPASVHKSIISQATHIFVGQLFEPRDMEYLAATIGDAAFRAKSLQKRQFLHFEAGKPEVKLISS